MKRIVKMAAGNVAANKKRTLITLTTIIVGLCAINIGKSMMAGMQRESMLGVTEGRTGELQVHRQGYFDASELTMLSYSMEGFAGLRDELERVDGVAHVAGRIQFGAILAREDQPAVVVFCRAVDPVNEVKVCPRIADNVVEGRFLTAADENGAVVAAGLSKGIGTKIGDQVILVANTKDGFQNAVEVEIVGVVEEKAAQANTRLVYLPIGKAQELLYMEDEATEIVISTTKNTQIDVLNKKLNLLLKDRKLAGNTWEDVSAFFVDIVEKQNAVVFALSLIFYCIVVSSITNTMILTIFERKKEIGTMMAIGIKARHVVGLVVAESTIIGFVGSLTAIIASALVIALLNRAGVTLRGPTGSMTIRPLISPAFMFLSFVLGVLCSVVASVYPARKVLDMSPIDAIRGT